MKGHTMISVEVELIKQAKERCMNISEVCEKAIRDKLNNKIDVKEELRTCRFCSSTEDLTFLCPDEVWICPKCLKGEISKVSVCIGTRK